MYEQTYRSHQVPRYEKPRRRHTGRIIALVILLICLLSIGLYTGYHLLFPTAIRTTKEIRTFNLSAGTQPTLIVTDNDGFVHVHPGNGNTVTVATTKVGDSFGASPDDFKVSYSQSGNTITIQVTNSSIHLLDFSQTSQADLDITLPARSDLRIQTDSGNITATSIQGKMNLTSDSGSMQIADASLKSSSTLSTNSGNITMTGSIDTTGRYMFQSDSGDIDIALPRGTSFHVNLNSDSGTITNDFQVVPAKQSLPSTRTVVGDVGSAPQATVAIQSNSGSLRLRQI
ncbi:MAG TPA: DUF4097 family beta strand repeat-containing protein [Ktedonobacteraceae bacterium]|nr:DUF4097 family beta strand repeat-containing protein [Ktedonobacteraceae bacterium]